METDARVIQATKKTHIELAVPSKFACNTESVLSLRFPSQSNCEPVFRGELATHKMPVRLDAYIHGDGEN
jgi:hypothetical protein